MTAIIIFFGILMLINLALPFISLVLHKILLQRQDRAESKDDKFKNVTSAELDRLIRNIDGRPARNHDNI